MGGGTYSTSSRNSRLSADYSDGAFGASGPSGVSGLDALEYLTSKSASSAHKKAVLDKVFVQTRESRMHQSMSPFQIRRESRDSAAHPRVIPILFGLDVTGSMQDLPKYLIASELPTLMSKLLQSNIDPAILFCAIGDHESDRAPFQVGQFESGDAELDYWLTHTWLEGNGGGNTGESYHLLWHFANNFVDTDYESKHNQKPIIITVGDEPVLGNLPGDKMKSIFGQDQASTLSAKEILTAAEKRFEIFHIHVNHGGHRRTDLNHYLGKRCQTVERMEEVVPAVIKIMLSLNVQNAATAMDPAPTSTKETPAKDFNFGEDIL